MDYFFSWRLDLRLLSSIARLTQTPSPGTHQATGWALSGGFVFSAFQAVEFPCKWGVLIPHETQEAEQESTKISCSLYRYQDRNTHLIVCAGEGKGMMALCKAFTLHSASLSSLWLLRAKL